VVLLWESRHGGGAPGGGAPDGGGGGGAPDGSALEAQRCRERVAQLEAEMSHDRRQGRHDGERAPHRWCGSFSPDWHQGHDGVPAVVRDGGCGLVLNKTPMQQGHKDHVPQPHKDQPHKDHRDLSIILPLSLVRCLVRNLNHPGK
jgi:hypothetical protein